MAIFSNARITDPPVVQEDTCCEGLETDKLVGVTQPFAMSIHRLTFSTLIRVAVVTAAFALVVVGHLDDNGQPVLVKGKPSWSLSKVNYTLNVGTGPTPAAPAAAPAPVATTPPTPALALTPTNGLKIGTAVSAGTYDAKVGKYTVRIVIPANTTTDLVDPESVMFSNNKSRQLAIFSDPQTFADPLFDQKDFSGQLRPFFPTAAPFETFFARTPSSIFAEYRITRLQASL